MKLPLPNRFDKWSCVHWICWINKK